MVAQKEIINVDRLNNFFGRNNGQFDKVRVTSPLLENYDRELPVTDFNSLKDNLLEIANNFPHRRVALTFEINENSSLSIEVHPITTTA